MFWKNLWSGIEDKLIQYIIRVNEDYGVASIRPLTEEDIDNINLNEWNFEPYSKVKERWDNERQKQDSKRTAGSNRKVQKGTTGEEEEATTILYQ